MRIDQCSATSGGRSRPCVLRAGVARSAVRIAALPGGEPPTLRRGAGKYEDVVLFVAGEAEGRLELQGLRIETPDGLTAVVCGGPHCRAELRDCTLSGRVLAVGAHSGAKVRVEGGALRGCPWDSSTCAFAAHSKHWDCLQYAVDNKAPGWEIYAERHAKHFTYEMSST